MAREEIGQNWSKWWSKIVIKKVVKNGDKKRWSKGENGGQRRYKLGVKDGQFFLSKMIKIGHGQQWSKLQFYSFYSISSEIQATRLA